MMAQVAGHILRAGALWAALWAATMIAGALLWAHAPAAEGAGEANVLWADLIITATNAILLAWLAARSRFSRLGRFAMLATLYFVIRGLMTYSEVLFFGAWFDFGALDYPRLIAMEAIVALGVGAAGAALYPVRAEGEAARLAPNATAWAWRLAAAAGLYLVAYWLAGLFIAWSSPAVGEFYGGEEFLARVDVPALIGFQILRGLIWAGLVVLVMASHRGAFIERALAAACAVTIILAILLIRPSDFMPQAVAYRHLIEIAVSNMSWGLAASFLLAPLVGAGARERGRANPRAARRSPH